MFLICALCAVLSQVLPVAAPRDASISGQVADKASGQPLPRMAVVVSPADVTKAVQTLTDHDGRYAFAHVPPGKYAVVADNDDHHATYLRQWFGQPEPAGTPAVPVPSVEIGAGESRSGVDIALTRALALDGHVLDPGGEPQRGADVYVTDPDGRRLVGSSSTSNDLGAYRVYGLRPGNYRVCAEVTSGVDFSMTADGRPPAPTCYPTIPLTTEDAFNLDIHMQWPAGARAATAEDDAVPSATPATGTIHGVITDAQTGRPLAHAVVHLQNPSSTPNAIAISARTNGDGAFTIFGLAPGQYNGFATATGHQLAMLAARGNARELTVLTGDVLAVSAALPPAYAINLRLVDPFDAPVSRVGVQVRTEHGDLVATAFTNLSDDLGRVRVSRLAPGRYTVCAEPLDTGASTPLGPQKRDRLLPTCYPGAREADALPITITSAEIDDLEIRLVRGRAFSIAGTIVDASGAPAPRAVARISKYLTNGSTSGGFEIASDGHFEIAHLEPGDYAIEAITDREIAFAAVRLEHDDIDNLVVTMRRTTTVSGLITLESGSAALSDAPGRAPLEIGVRLADDRLPNVGSSRYATANSDGTFELEEVFGTRRIEVQRVPQGWYVKAIRYGTKDVTDEPVEFKDGGGPLEVVLSNQGASIGGAVVDGTAVRTARPHVLLFSTPATANAVPRLAGAVLSAGESYNFGPIRSGDYTVVAVPADTPIPRPFDLDRIAALAAIGEHVTLSDLEHRTVDVHVTAVRLNHLP